MSKEEKKDCKSKCNCHCHSEEKSEKTEKASCKCNKESESCNCNCGCNNEDGCKCGENGCCNENCKCGELKEKVELLEKQLADEKKTASGYLSTASYYKTQSEDTKKDFDRYKERNKNIEDEAKTKANEAVAKKILPVIDNFDQAIAHINDAEIIKGFSMIYSSLISVLTDIGVKEIDCKKGDELNPEYHNCISTEDTDDESLNEHISSIYQKGYMFAESKKVIRPATVSVYKK